MEHRIEFAGEGPQHVTITLSGRASIAGFHELVHALEREPRATPGMLVLVDLTAFDPSAFGEQSLQEAARPMLERDWHTRPRAVAIVAPDDDTRAAAKLWRAHLGGSVSRRRIFLSRDEALDWLAEH